jgi:SET and MYND domain-containing protein 4
MIENTKFIFNFHQFSAMYCSEECKSKAMQEYHSFECNNEINLSDYSPIKMLLHAIRIAGGVNSLRLFLESDEGKKDVTVFDFDLLDINDPCYERNLLCAALSLKVNIDVDQLSSEMMVLHGVIVDNPKLKKMWNFEENGRFLDELLKKLCKISLLVEVNKQWSTKNLRREKSDANTSEDGVFVNPVGFNVDPYSALMNGSCSPNIRLISVGNKNLWVCVKPIKAGDQLFKTYGEDFITETGFMRRRKLLWKFGYECECIACLKDFPQIDKLNSVDYKFVYETKGLMDHTTAKEKFKQHCKYINENFNNFPSKELCFSMSMIAYKLGVIARPLDF